MIYNGVLYISGHLSIDPETGKVQEGGIKQEYIHWLIAFGL